VSDLTLLIFGCVVSFIAVAGVFVYVQESTNPSERTDETEAPRAKGVERKLRDVA
jgi:hypothetical protein